MKSFPNDQSTEKIERIPMTQKTVYRSKNNLAVEFPNFVFLGHSSTIAFKLLLVLN